MHSRPTENPPSRFASQTVEYDDGDGPPPSSITLLEDHSRSILSHNDSPDLPFSWSANPYRGCISACSYCLGGDTPILLADGRTRRLADLAIGEQIVGTAIANERRIRVPTVVLDHWSTTKLAYRVTVSDRSELIASADHRFLTDHGWKHVRDVETGPHRPHLDRNDAMIDETFEPSAGKTIASIEPVGEMRLYDITTGTGDFIANGVVSHNCYARPTHEYLDLGAGTDFDTKIVIKPKAPELLREAFEKKSWTGELVMFSGVTDCYQPIEKTLRLTRGCLEVCLEYRNPVSIISKHALVERDVDLIAELAREAGAHLAVSLAWTNAELARAVEPWAASPERRLKVIETFARAGVSVGVMCAPIIPGLNDDQMVGVLERARDAGATAAGWVILRLPGATATVFEQRIREVFPLRADKIMHRIRETRGGERLYDPRFHTRGRGEGPYAQILQSLFDATVARLGLNARRHDDGDAAPSRFRRPSRDRQLSLFR